MRSDLDPAEVDLSSTKFWSRTMRERDADFAKLRAVKPISQHRPMEGSISPNGKGFWAVTRHADVQYASRHPELFCNSGGVGWDDLPGEMMEAIASFLVTDAPRHTKLRRLISSAFTPKHVQTFEGQIRRQAKEIVADVLQHDSCDIVADLAVRLPLYTISEMVGVPEERREELISSANIMVGANDPDFVPPGEDGFSVLMAAAIQLSMLGSELAGARRADPQHDLMTALVSADVEGERLTDSEIGAFMCLLGVAGNDTTRNSIAHGVHAFATHPDQWAIVRSDPESRLPLAVEEIVRWSTPVMDFRRTAAHDTELGGEQIRAGDFVVLFYASANRDEMVFDDPWKFDVTRDPNEHLGFGGGGPHFCLGASLARTQLRAVFHELAGAVRAFDVDEPDLLLGNFMHGVKRLPCRFERS